MGTTRHEHDPLACGDRASVSAIVPVSDHRRLGDLSQFNNFASLDGCKCRILKRRGVRVVEGARLESVCRGNSTEGSNPSLSAKFRSASFGGARRLLGHRAIRFAHRDLARIPRSLVGRRETASRASRDSLSLIATWLESLSPPKLRHLRFGNVATGYGPPPVATWYIDQDASGVSHRGARPAHGGCERR